MRFYSADEILSFYGVSVPIPWHRQPNAGQHCAKCGGICGPRAITDGSSVWHPECKSFTTFPSNARTNLVYSDQPHLDPSVKTKMHRGGRTIKKFEREMKLAEKRQSKQAKKSAPVGSSPQGVAPERVRAPLPRGSLG
jgi:hypothetical protein